MVRYVETQRKRMREERDEQARQVLAGNASALEGVGIGSGGRGAGRGMGRGRGRGMTMPAWMTRGCVVVTCCRLVCGMPTDIAASAGVGGAPAGLLRPSLPTRRLARPTVPVLVNSLPMQAVGLRDATRVGLQALMVLTRVGPVTHRRTPASRLEATPTCRLLSE